MELQPAVHMQQHLNHGHQSHHNDLNIYQHQMTNINNSNGEEKNKKIPLKKEQTKVKKTE
ncbi:CLUMA_CG021211, isoform A [Clunio marinus]|uniref:CLUMA_CG021211, isoform A n=1 Tax=Clunio marinus TaxID=568069 RepID=A0A1J1J7P1_9DIPT|nr:CLUMA_CG021211, isoform A [Clunio marinus]